MRLHDDESTKQMVQTFYNNINVRLKMMKMRWMDLAKIVGIDHRTLSSMKSQNQNPSVTVGLKIADALGCSLEELLRGTDQPGFRFDSDDFTWMMKRILSDSDEKQLRQIANIACTLTGNPDISMHRYEIMKEDMLQKLHDIYFPEGERIENEDGSYVIVTDIRTYPQSLRK